GLRPQRLERLLLPTDPSLDRARERLGGALQRLAARLGLPLDLRAPPRLVALRPDGFSPRPNLLRARLQRFHTLLEALEAGRLFLSSRALFSVFFHIEFPLLHDEAKGVAILAEDKIVLLHVQR